MRSLSDATPAMPSERVLIAPSPRQMSFASVVMDKDFGGRVEATALSAVKGWFGRERATALSAVGVR